nr:hypothetical protein StreXyl84_64300 [Streptomyces sp. Xyl84]
MHGSPSPGLRTAASKAHHCEVRPLRKVPPSSAGSSASIHARSLAGPSSSKPNPPPSDLHPTRSSCEDLLDRQTLLRHGTGDITAAFPEIQAAALTQLPSDTGMDGVM